MKFRDKDVAIGTVCWQAFDEMVCKKKGKRKKRRAKRNEPEDSILLDCRIQKLL